MVGVDLRATPSISTTPVEVEAPATSSSEAERGVLSSAVENSSVEVIVTSGDEFTPSGVADQGASLHRNLSFGSFFDRLKGCFAI